MTTSTMPDMTPSHDYRRKAEAVAQRVTEKWRESEDIDPRRLSDAVYAALVEEGNLEMRQLLTQMGAHLELAMSRMERAQPPFTPERLARLHGLVTRASSILDIYMDRASAAKILIRLEPEPFDLAEAIHQFVTLHQMDMAVTLRMEPTPMVGDRGKLLDALGHLLTRFYFAARPHERVSVSVGIVEGRIEGFIGLSPSHLEASQLMEEMHLPMQVEDIGIDVAYARAVLERHEGNLFVATADEGSVGFGFYIPLQVEVSE